MLQRLQASIDSSDVQIINMLAEGAMGNARTYKEFALVFISRGAS
jgi:hypothetical protein